jgi:glycosyltransferase involved in cell wall biosynthesis
VRALDQADMVSPSLAVLQLLPALESGGVERGTLEVGRYLVEHGHRSLVMSAGGRLVEQLTTEGSRHFCWPIGEKSLRTLGLVRKLRRLMVEQQVGILHVRSRLPAWIGYLAWRGMDPATRPHLVSTFHGFYSVNPYSAIMTKAEHIIAVSDCIAVHIAEEYRPQAPVTTIHRGIDPGEYSRGFRPGDYWQRRWADQYPHLRGKRLVTLPGRITRLKGHHDFIEIMGQLKAMMPGVHGLIVGGYEPRRSRYFAELEEAIRGRGLSSDITFTGNRGDLKEIMSISALVLSLSSQPESFGRTVLEALALGVPVGAFDHGGVSEILGAMLPAGLVSLKDLPRLIDVSAGFLRQAPAIGNLPERFMLETMLSGTLAVYCSLRGESSARQAVW